ncbi:V-type ATP synthase subunit A [Halobacteriales archaeon QH_10_67_13]|nr:MAG: V-type ATP synthase subunit A [Halobacteriales archaeon QH_10_67_13]
MSKATDGTVREDGRIESVSGPVVTAVGLDTRMNDVVYVGEEGLMGEVIEIDGDVTTIQVYEETSGVSPGEPVETTGAPLSVDLGPGILDTVYDGVQRPLDVLEDRMDSAFLDRGVDAPGIDLGQTWEFTPTVEPGEEVEPGDVVGTVPETPSIDHKVMVPPDAEGGTVASVESGTFTVEETVVELDSGEEIAMHQEWPVRQQRPAAEKVTPTIPLVSGQRVLDGLFPIAKGGTAAIPGPFGSGKCVTPETPVMLANGERVPIEELFERLTEDVPEDGEVLREAEAEILTFDEDAGTIRPATTSHVYRGSTDRLVRVRTASGRTLEVTPDHKLFRLRGDLAVEETPAGAIEDGDSLVMPRRLAVDAEPAEIDPYELLTEMRAVEDGVTDQLQAALEGSKLSTAELARALDVPYHTAYNYLGPNNPRLGFIADACSELGVDRPGVERVKPGSNGKPVRIPERVDESFAEFLGVVLSDGMLTEETVRFHNTDETLRARFSELAAELFGVDTTVTVHNTVETVEIRSRVIVSLLAALGVPASQKSRRAVVPDVIAAGPDRVVAAFLRGYYLGDGSFSGGTVEIATSSEAMASGLTYLLSRIGVLYRVRERENDSHRVSVTGADELATLHDALADGSGHEKVDQIGEYAASTTGNTNVDTVPVGAETMVEIAEAARYSDFADAGVETTNYTGLGERPSRDAFDAIETVLADGGSTIADRVGAVSEMLEDVFFDPVVEVETVETEQTVYDVTVPDTQNFVGGNVPSVLHNTVTQQSLAKFADADIVVYIGCGERGNEMTEVIDDFPELPDPQTGNALMARTCLIANTSNMPVAARESCIYTGITIAEYYRDMGYDVALMADSTSRWAEAMREISARLEEMPGEEGYPAYLAARLAAFYERAGYFENVNGTEGSVTAIGAVSPPGGDFSEPVTQNTLRIVKTFWALDSDLAERRHFPAINWNESYSLYRDQLDEWFVENVAEDWPELRQWAVDTLDEESELQEIVQLVGEDALPEDQRLTLDVARYLREAYLQQNALDEVDRYSPPEKTYRILEAIKTFNDEAFAALDASVPVEEITEIDAPARLTRAGTTPDDEIDAFLDEVETEITEQLQELY